MELENQNLCSLWLDWKWYNNLLKDEIFFYLKTGNGRLIFRQIQTLHMMLTFTSLILFVRFVFYLITIT